MKLVIDGIQPWDGEYPLDFTFTNREMYRIRQISGLRGAEVLDALANDDNAAYVAVAAVVLGRAGHDRLDVDKLWDSESGSILIFADPASDAGPPPASNPSDPPENETSSGESSSGSSEA